MQVIAASRTTGNNAFKTESRPVDSASGSVDIAADLFVKLEFRLLLRWGTWRRDQP